MRDAAIILSGHLTTDRNMDDELRKSVDVGIAMLNRGYVRFLIMNGGPGRFTDMTLVPRGTYPVHADAMRDHALENGVHPERVLTQDWSSDTLGEAYFVKKLHLEPGNLKRNVVITRRYHVPRSALIYSMVLGPDFDTEYVGTDGPRNTQIGVLCREAYLIAGFLLHTALVDFEDPETIEHYLYTSHPHYKRIPRERQLRFHG